MQALPNLPSYIVIALAVFVYLIIQLAKRRLPDICGRYALAINFMLSAIGVILSTSPDQVLTGHTLSTIFAVTGVAAGVHGTVSKLTPAGEGEGANTSASSLIALLILFVLPLTGCKPVKAPTPAILPTTAADQIDFNANRILQAAHGFAMHVSADVIDKKLTLTKAQLTTLGNLNASINVGDALEIAYHRCAIIRNAQPANAPACDATSLQNVLVEVQKSFGDTEIALAPTASK